MVRLSKTGMRVLLAAALLTGCESARPVSVSAPPRDPRLAVIPLPAPPRVVKPGFIPLETADPKYQEYFKQLRQKILANWVYPWEAGSRGIEGDLEIEFVIAKNGHLQYIERSRSSGVTLLDNAALNAVKLTQPFPPVPDALLGVMPEALRSERRGLPSEKIKRKGSSPYEVPPEGVLAVNGFFAYRMKRDRDYLR